VVDVNLVVDVVVPVVDPVNRAGLTVVDLLYGGLIVVVVDVNLVVDVVVPVVDPVIGAG
jgi:hypothetical protein